MNIYLYTNPLYLLERLRMTTAFDQLQEQPQPNIKIDRLSPEERILVRQIRITGTTGEVNDVPAKRFTSVFYIFGDEQSAAERFVELNREPLSELDYSTNNLISSSVSREIYDEILHVLGERRLERYSTVVIERRASGETWCISRRTFDKRPLRRYTETGVDAGKVMSQSLKELYNSFEFVIQESDLDSCACVSGDSRQILDAFRQSPDFECLATTVDGELAVRKVDSK